MAQQIKVADGVEHLVFDELVVVAQSVLVEHAELVHDDGVVERAAERETLVAQVFDLMHEAERARARDLFRIGGIGEVDADGLAATVEHGMREGDGEFDLEAVMRDEARPLVAVAHLDRLRDAHVLLRRILLDDAGGLQQEHEGRRGAVHDGNLGAGQIDQQVVDAEAGEGRHQVLDGRHLGGAGLEHRAQPGVGDQIRVGLDFGGRDEIHPPEHDAGIGTRRAQGHLDLDAGMQADAGRLDRRFESALLHHPIILTGRGSGQPSARHPGTTRIPPFRFTVHPPRPVQSAWRRRKAGMSRVSMPESVIAWMVRERRLVITLGSSSLLPFTIIGASSVPVRMICIGFWACRATGLPRPVATMVTRSASSMPSSSTWPTMTVASSAVKALMVFITSWISFILTVDEAVMLTSTPRAPARLTSSSSGLATACSAAMRARFSPLACAEPIIAMPISLITVRTSAKSTLTRPGQLMTSAMPPTAPCSTLLAALKASSMETSSPSTCISFSLGMMISEST